MYVQCWVEFECGEVCGVVVWVVDGGQCGVLVFGQYGFVVDYFGDF